MLSFIIFTELLTLTELFSAANADVENACFVKLPYWSFTEAGYNHYTLNNKTTSGGQALGIGRNFESAFLKALQSTTGFSNNVKTFKKEYKKSEKELLQDLSKPNEIHLITLLAAIAKGPVPTKITISSFNYN